MSTQLWGGTVNLEGSDELGNIPTNGEARQSETGRPVGTFTSDIKTATRVDPGPGEGGGGGGGGGVTAVFTGPGLIGGPIFAEGTISLLPPTSGSIGGVKAGANITIDPDGTISSSGGGGGGTVSSIVFGNGLTGGTITQSGTVGVNIGAGLQLASNGSLAVKPGSTSEIGGVKAGTAINISAEGTISVLPPAGPIIGGVKAGTGVVISSDGTISATGGGGGGVVTLLGDLSSQFNGTLTQFTLTSNTIPFSPIASHYALISVGGIIQATPSAYGIIGSTITFTSPPPAGATFYGIAFG